MSTSKERRAKLLKQYEEIDRHFMADPWAYFYNVVKIKPKVGGVVPFKGNWAQHYVHDKLEEQKQRTGRVRAIILKARQLGISTYVAARFYRGSTFYPGMGTRTYIMTHESMATANLFGMAKRMHDYSPVDFKHTLKASNANELEFKGMEAGYRVGTAGAHATGRSLTIQQLHSSELAFWEDADEHFSGVFQTVPKEDGTEIIIESTANGVGGTFYNQWQLAEAGKSEYIPIFLPWYWEEKYRQGLPAGFRPSAEEEEYAQLYGLDEQQLCWMHFKNIELNGTPGIIGWRFRRDYPACSVEAFQTSGEDTLIKPVSVMRARKHELNDDDVEHAPPILGVDIARGGKDDTRLIDRRGRKLGGLVNETIDKADLMAIADRVAHLINEHHFVLVNVDVTGLGAGVYDRLVQLGYSAVVRAINFGQKASEPGKYFNKRAEMWCRLRDWLEDPGAVDIPDDDVVHRHFCSAGYVHDANSRWKLEKKEEIKKRLGFSPDCGDAAALTFAENAPGMDVVTADKPSWLDKLHGVSTRRRGASWMSR